VHPVRQKSDTYRRLRPRVLARFCAAFPAALLAAGLAACSAAGTAGPGVAWFQLQSGVFQPIAGPSAAVAVPNRPWTVQSRVADMVFLGDTLYCGVNGSGLATLAVDTRGTAAFSYHADSMIFAHRTITTLIPREGTLAVHLYYNALLNDVPQQDLMISGISLVIYLPSHDDFSFLIPPFQKKNPDWEAVGIAPLSPDQFDFEWKYTDSTQTRFAYTRFHADTRQEESADRDAYVAALGTPSITGAGVPSDRAAFFDTCRAQTSGVPRGVSLQFSIRSKESPFRLSYRSEPESESAVVFPVFESPGMRLALLPEGRVLRSAPNTPDRAFSLPSLPKGFRYTDLVEAGSWLVVPWEETSFTDVGRAGILLFQLREERPRPAGSSRS
jgi:hypothetical protein